MDFSGLYELLERFHRSNQLPAFLIGFFAALVLAYIVLRFLRLRILGIRGRDGEIRALEIRAKELIAENKQLQRDLRHTEKHAEAIKAHTSELSGRLKVQNQISSGLSVQCEQLKEQLLNEDHERRRLLEGYRKSRRTVARLNEKLETIASGDGRIWEVAAECSATPFRPLSQRRTPVFSFVNLSRPSLREGTSFRGA